MSITALLPIHLNPLLNRLPGLIPWQSCGRPKHELRLETPVLRHVPFSLDAAVDERVVVLEIGAEAFGFEGGPDWEGECVSFGVERRKWGKQEME